MFDSIIIGKGPAGIQAALYMKRANLDVLVIGKDNGALEKAQKIENFYGQENVISGKDLVNKGISQADKLGIKILTDEVVSIEFCDIKKFKVKTLKDEYLSKTVIIATGSNRNAPLIKGVKEFEGHGVSYCALCDGFFYKNKSVVVIGNGNYAISEAQALLPVTDKITILTNGKSEVLTRNKNIICNTKSIEKIVGDKTVEKIVFKDNTELNAAGVFIAEGVATSVDFAKRIGAEIENNKIVVDSETMQTSVPGLFAAGDCTGEIYQISKAIYEGMKAALSAIKYVEK